METQVTMPKSKEEVIGDLKKAAREMQDSYGRRKWGSDSNGFSFKRAAEIYKELGSTFRNGEIVASREAATDFLGEEKQYEKSHGPLANYTLIHLEWAINVLAESNLKREAIPLAEEFIKRFSERAEYNEEGHDFRNAMEDMDVAIGVAKRVGLEDFVKELELDRERLENAQKSYQRKEKIKHVLRGIEKHLPLTVNRDFFKSSTWR